MQCITSLCIVLCVSACAAIPRELLYPHGAGTDLVLPRDLDEASSPEIALRVPIVFYDETYNSIYVSLYSLLYFYCNLGFISLSLRHHVTWLSFIPILHSDGSRFKSRKELRLF
jgi:hypothetical protein